MAQVTELITKFSFAGSTAPLFNFNKGLGSGIKMTAAFSAALVTGTAVALKWGSSVLQSLDPLVQMEKRTGVAVGRIQELGYIAGQSGSSIDAMMSTVLSMSQTIGDAAINGSEDFARLGISIRDSNGELKNADTILTEVGGRFQTLNLSMQEQESIAGALGIDATLVQMLNRSSGELAELSKQAREYGTISKGQSEQIREYNEALNRQKFAMSAVKQQVAIGLAPTLTDLAEKFTTLVANNKEWITAFAGKAIDVVVEFGEAIANVSGIVFDFVDAITMGHGKASLLIGVLAGAAVAFPVTAAIIGITLAVDDLVTAFEGGDSVIADFFEDNFGVDIVQTLEEVWGALDGIYKIMTDIINLDFGSAGSYVLSMIESTQAGIAQAVGLNQETNAIPSDVWDQFDLVPGANGLAPTSRGGQTIQQDVQININTNDPSAAGIAVRDKLQEQLDNANTQFGIGGQ